MTGDFEGNVASGRGASARAPGAPPHAGALTGPDEGMLTMDDGRRSG
jgi:hypothetical protein